MNLVPQPVNRLWQDWSQSMNDFMSHWVPAMNHGQPSGLDSFWAQLPPRGEPALDIEETDTDVHVRAEIPGMEKDEFSVDVSGNRLSIRGEKKQKREWTEGSMHRLECSYGQFVRQVLLPAEVDDTRSEAEYKNGVLYIRLPKTAQSQRKQIPVHVN